MSFQPNFFHNFSISSTLCDLPKYVIFFQNYLWIWRYKGVKGKNVIGAAKKNNFEFFSD